jgi:protein-tyrosine-phosphatase
LEVAASRGLDLLGHRSQLLTAPLVAAADLILVMDTRQRWAMRALFGRARQDVIVLGDLDAQTIETREIRDPFEQPKHVFELSYTRIDRCIGELVRAVSQHVQEGPARGVPLRRPRDQDGQHQERTA